MKQIFLAPLSCLYGLILISYRLLYKYKIFKIHKISVPTISVGSITSFEKGITYFVLYLSKLIKKGVCSHYVYKKRDIVILKKRYTKVLENDVSLVTGRNRIKVARKIVSKNRDTCIILYDGFQTLSLARELNIVLINGVEPFGDGLFLPAGRLKFPLSALNKANLFVIIKDDGDIEKIKKRLTRINPEIPVIEAKYKKESIEIIKGKEILGDALQRCWSKYR